MLFCFVHGAGSQTGKNFLFNTKLQLIYFKKTSLKVNFISVGNYYAILISICPAENKA
jgi:hypothetical protein